MPPVKPRDMEDTWNPAELEKSLKGTKDDKKRHRDKDRDKDRERRKERPKDDEDRKHRKRKDEDGERKDRDKEKRDRDKDRDREKRDRDKDKDRERRHRDKENGEKESKPKKTRPPKDEVDGEERRHRRRDGEEKDEDRERRRRKHKEEGEDNDKDKRRRHHDDEDDEERRKRREERRKHRDGEEGEGKERRKHRDDDERKHKDRDDERRRRHPDEDDDRRRRHKEEDKDKDKDRRRHREDKDEERDRRREERRHRDRDEDKESKRHRDKDKDKDKEKERSSKKEKEKEEKKSAPKEEEEDEYNYDDDDFEDYEEDFEEDDDDGEESDQEVNERDRVNHQGKSRREMDDILQAMDAENSRLVSESRNKQRDESPEDQRRSSKRPTTGKARINFVSAKQRQISSKASSRAKTRGRELLQIIELDRVAYDLFDMPPVGEYELYMRTFGRSDTKQVYIQTNEDNLDKDIQTEEIEAEDKWCQFPPEETKGCGGDKDTGDDFDTKPVDTAALTKFVQNAGQAILILLEEERAEASQSDTSRKRSNICLSEAFLEIEAPPFLTGRCVSFTQFSEAQTHMLLTVHDRPDTNHPDDKLSSKGAVCIWNVNEPSRPQKVLVCEGQPKCCCFSPVKANLVFAGMVDGSVAVWDLREANSLHRRHTEGDDSWFLRHPTYNTAGVLHYENHQSSVTSVVPIYVPGNTGELEASDPEESASFQLATVEETATLNLWVVAEIVHPDPAGSESDLGLAPGGRIKLIKSSAIVLENPMREARLRTTMKAFEMKLLPSDPSHFYVGTDTGHILHGVRFGGKAPPKAYKPDIDAPIEVTSIDFSPFTEPVFLAGCADGSIRLYHVNNASPVIVWESTTGGRPILAVRWCQSRPNVFFVVDAGSRLYIWDLLMSDAVPMKEDTISKDRLTSFCLSNDYAATGLGLPGRKPAMAVSFENGRVEVHTVSQQFSALMPEEVDQFAQFLAAST